MESEVGAGCRDRRVPRAGTAAEPDPVRVGAGSVLKVLTVTTVGTALFAIVTGFLVGWSSVPVRFAIALICSTVIGAAAALILPPLAHRLSARSPTVAWLGIAGALVAIAVPGSLVAGAVAQALGLVEPGSFWAVQREGFGITLVMTLTIGMAISIHERTRARLDWAPHGAATGRNRGGPGLSGDREGAPGRAPARQARRARRARRLAGPAVRPPHAGAEQRQARGGRPSGRRRDPRLGPAAGR